MRASTFSMRIIPFILTCVCALTLHGQSDYVLFQKGITLLNRDYKTSESTNMKTYSALKPEMNKHVAASQGTVLQSSQEKADEGQPRFIDEPIEPVVLSTTELNAKLNVSSGRYTDPAWSGSDAFFYTGDTPVEDIQDPAERKKWMDIAEFQDAVYELNKGSVVAAMYQETRTEEQFDQMMALFALRSIHLSDAFKSARAADEARQAQIMREELSRVADELLSR